MTGGNAAGRGRAWHGIRLGLALLACLARPALADPMLAVDSDHFANLFDAGETPVLTLTVQADDDGFSGRVVVDVRDAYRVRTTQVKLPVDLPPGGRMTHEFGIVSVRLGFLTIDTKLVDGRGRSPASITTTAAILPPIQDSDAETSAAGYFVFPDDTELPHADEIAAEMRRLGIRWVRLTFNWWLDERSVRPDVENPAWLNTASYERWVDAFRANGIEVLGVLFGTARWASASVNENLIYGVPAWALVPSHDPADWELFVRTMAQRLKGRVRTWEVWNEPDITLFWMATSADFVSLTRSTAAVLREVDPTMRVAVNLVNRGTDDGIAFYNAVVAGAGDVLDIFGLHYSRPEWVDVTVATKPLLRSPGAIWNTEAWGAPRLQISTWLSQRAAGVERIFPFLYHSLLDDSEVDDFKRFGLYPVNLDYTPRTDGIAYRTMSDLVGSATPVDARAVGLGYSAYTFAGQAGTVVALADLNELGPTWSGPPGVRLWLRLPARPTQVTVVDLMGNRQTVRVRRGRMRLRLLGVAAFLLPEPGESLAGLRVVRSRGARKH